MMNWRSPMIKILVFQIIAIILYPPTFFQQAPQAAVLPPALFFLAVIAIIAINTGGLSPAVGRSSLNFVQGVNIVVRMMMFFPNLKGPTGAWNWVLLIMQIIAIGLSWYTMIQIEKYPVNALVLKSVSQ